MVEQTMEEKVLERLNLEKQVYEFLGVRTFQKLVFLLEKIIHWKDNKKNTNYHFGQDGDMRRFIKFLFYNGTIHVRNIVFITLYFIVKILFFELFWWDALLVLLGIKDIYCVMLQRYNYLRIQEHLYKKEIQSKIRNDSRIELIKKHNLGLYDASNKQRDLELIKKLKNAIEHHECVVLGNEEIEALVGLNILLYGNTKEES